MDSQTERSPRQLKSTPLAIKTGETFDRIISTALEALLGNQLAMQEWDYLPEEVGQHLDGADTIV